MSVPIDDEQRGKVLELARAGRPRNEVARETGVSTASVSRICAEAGVTFDRTTTAVAVQARVIDLKAARVNLAGNLLDDVQEARHRMLGATAARDFVDLARAVSALTAAHVRLVTVDGPPDTTQDARSMLGKLGEALGALMDPAPQTDPPMGDER